MFSKMLKWWTNSEERQTLSSSWSLNSAMSIWKPPSTHFFLISPRLCRSRRCDLSHSRNVAAADGRSIKIAGFAEYHFENFVKVQRNFGCSQVQILYILWKRVCRSHFAVKVAKITPNKNSMWAWLWVFKVVGAHAASVITILLYGLPSTPDLPVWVGLDADTPRASALDTAPLCSLSSESM